MTELPQHSIQKYLSDRAGRQQGTPPPPPPPPPPSGEQGGKKEAVEGHHHHQHAKRHQHKESIGYVCSLIITLLSIQDQAARHKEYRRVASAGPGPRRLSVCDSVTSKVVTMTMTMTMSMTMTMTMMMMMMIRTMMMFYLLTKG